MRAHQISALCPYTTLFRSKFALGVYDLGPTLALGFGLLGHGALHGVWQRYVLYLYRRDFHAPRFGLPVDDLLQLLVRSEEHTSELQSRGHLVCRLLLEKKN